MEGNAMRKTDFEKLLRYNVRYTPNGSTKTKSENISGIRRSTVIFERVASKMRATMRKM
jgi:hypothetical protein